MSRYTTFMKYSLVDFQKMQNTLWKKDITTVNYNMMENLYANLQYEFQSAYLLKNVNIKDFFIMNNLELVSFLLIS